MSFWTKKPTAEFTPPEPLDASLSPVQWLSHAAWQRRKQWSRFPRLKAEVDGPALLVDAHPEIVDDRWRAARPPTAAHPPAPPLMSMAEASTALEQTEDVGAFWNPVTWPLCCGALTVLVQVNPTRVELEASEAALGSLDAACALDDAGWRADLAAIRAGGRPENGVNLFQCGHCGRSYGVHSHT